MLIGEKEINRIEWARHIEAQEVSGLSQRKWCEANQVNHHNFRYWRQRLKREDTNINQAGMNKTTEDAQRFEFAEVLVQPKHKGTVLLCTLVGLSISVESSNRTGYLCQLIRCFVPTLPGFRFNRSGQVSIRV